MFSKSKRFQYVPSEVPRKRAARKSGTGGKCETRKESPRAELRREGTFVIAKRGSGRPCPTKSPTNEREDGDIIYQSDRCIIRRTSARLNISPPNNNASSRSQSITPKQEDPSLCFSSKRCAIRRATSNKSSALNETSSSNRASRTLVIEVSSIYNNPSKGDASSGISTRRSKSTSTSACQNEYSNRTPHEEHSSKDLVSSIDSGMSLHSSAESLPTNDESPSASPKSSSPRSIQASLSEAVRKLKLLSNQTVSKTTNEIETRLDRLKTELKQYNYEIARNFEFETNKVLSDFTSTIRETVQTERNENLRDTINKLKSQLKDANSRRRALASLYRDVCEGNARKERQQREVVDQLKHEVDAMEIAFRMNKISKYFPENCSGFP